MISTVLSPLCIVLFTLYHSLWSRHHCNYHFTAEETRHREVKSLVKTPMHPVMKAWFKPHWSASSSIAQPILRVEVYKIMHVLKVRKEVVKVGNFWQACEIISNQKLNKERKKTTSIHFLNIFLFRCSSELPRVLFFFLSGIIKEKC